MRTQPSPVRSAPAGTPSPPLRLPCRPAQPRNWLLDRLEPGTAALNVALRWRIDAAVSVPELEGAVNRVVARHPALRTSFHEAEGAPLQAVTDAAPVRVPDIDLSALPAAAAEAEAERIAALEARAPFDLDVPPLLRVTHLRVRPQVSVLLVTVHRTVCDEAGVDVIARELAALYADAAAALAPPAARPEPSPRDARRAEAYWLGTLQGLRPFGLPGDHARPALRASPSGHAALRLPVDAIAGLQALALEPRGSLTLAAQATLFALLHRYSGEADIAVCVPARGADGPPPTSIVEDDVQVLRVDLGGDPAYARVLARVCEAAAAAADGGAVPFARVIELLAPERDLSRPALADVHFAVRLAPPAGAGARLPLAALPACGAGATRFDLEFRLDVAAGWELSCEYNHGLYAPDTIARLLRHYANLAAAGMVASRPVSRLPLLSPEEQRALEAFNPPEEPFPAHLTVVRLFDEQAARTPDRVALACGEQALTYRELQRRADRLARRLEARRIGRGARVGVCVERSPELVVALLGVLKSGAAWVPLDPGYPTARLEQILAGARPAAVVCGDAERACLATSPAPLLRVDEADAAGEPDLPPSTWAGPDDPAYVIFTSGSTGRPKGVEIRHRSLTNLLLAMRRRPGLDAHDTLVAVTTVSFDISILELFLPLIVGARLVIAQRAEAADGAALLALLARHRATVLQATPVTWRILLASGWRGEPALKMLCGGEALLRPLAQELLAQGQELWNLYGPTETTIWSSATRVASGDGPVPLGPPIANTQFHVLDRQRAPVPVGVAGELYIGGEGVAKGYVDLPELTRERFVPDTFRPHSGACLYRTGDRVRWRANGTLEFLGREDRQVKVRGFRIELGEIEAVLRGHRDVADCVAVVRPDASGEPAVQAYVVAGAEAAERGLVELLGRRLRAALPIYMCPAGITVVAALPRLPNGKLDPAALPAPLAPVSAGRAPLSAAEERLAQVWREVLELPRVGVDDSFFEVGGHSLLAVRLLARIEAAFGRRLTLTALFRHPTIAGQARLLEQAETRAFDFTQVVQLQAGSLQPPLIALNNTGIYYALSRRLGAMQPFVSLQLFDPALPAVRLPGTLEEIAAGYVELIRRVQPRGPYSLLGWCVAGTLAFEVACQLRAAGEGVARLILFDTLAPGYPARLPWLRARLAGAAYRWQLIAADWARARRGEARLASFLRNRITVRRLRALFAARPTASVHPRSPVPPAAPEQYDQWLLRYLEDAAAAYRPARYPGRVTLVRSSGEPAGPFLDPEMGWGPYAAGGVELIVVEGDHFSIFQEPGVSRMARALVSAAPP